MTRIKKWFRDNGWAWDRLSPDFIAAVVYPGEDFEKLIDPITITVTLDCGEVGGWWISASDEAVSWHQPTLLRAMNCAEKVRLVKDGYMLLIEQEAGLEAG